jgi:septal ring factor EnvC (AmiA/AmiB activator)
MALAITLPFGLPLSAAAQTDRPVALDAIKQRDQELEAIRAEQKKAAETQSRLRAEIDRLGEDRRKLTQTMIDTAARIRADEEAIAAIEQRLALLDTSEQGINASLERRRAVIAQILGALQLMGRHPPPALIVRPEDALQSVRTAILLGAVLPEMRSEAEALAGDLADLVRVRRESAEERDRRATDLAHLDVERQRMALLIAERQRRQGEIEKELEAERRRAAQLAQQADNLKDLIARLEHDLDTASRAGRAAQEPKAPGDARRDFAALKDPGRLTPAIAFASAKGLLPLPVNGVRTREFGAPDTLGGTEKGVSITTRAAAQVTSPCDGWVVYAAPYRSYGQLLILNAGGGYHVLLAGMERISVDLGQFVLTGEPVGVMGSGQTPSTIVAGSSRPVLYIEFRKDGSPVDPNPWWATNDSEKVRG